MKPIGVALLGYGLAGKVFHAPLIASVPGLSLDMVLSSDAEKVHRNFPDARVAPDLEAVLDDDGIDLVVVATPDILHGEHACAALKAGKHVVIDKPFAPTLAEARRIAAVASQSDRTLSVFHNRRWDADFLSLQRLIREDRLGPIVQFESHFDRYRPVVGTGWKDQRPGGVWQDLGPHLVDQTVRLFGVPDAVFADIGVVRSGGSCPDYAHVLLRYADTHVILHVSQLMAEHELRFAVHGTRGSYMKHGLDQQEPQARAGQTPRDPEWGLDPLCGSLRPTAGGTVQTHEPIDNERGDYPAFYRELERALRTGGIGPVPLQEALAVMEVLEAGLVSARERREVRISELGA